MEINVRKKDLNEFNISFQEKLKIKYFFNHDVDAMIEKMVEEYKIFEKSNVLEEDYRYYSKKVLKGIVDLIQQRDLNNETHIVKMASIFSEFLKKTNESPAENKNRFEQEFLYEEMFAKLMRERIKVDQISYQTDYDRELACAESAAQIQISRLRFRLGKQKTKKMIEHEKRLVRDIRVGRESMLYYVEIADFFKKEIDKIGIVDIQRYEAHRSEKLMKELESEEAASKSASKKKTKAKASKKKTSKKSSPIAEPCIEEKATTQKAKTATPLSVHGNEVLRNEFIRSLYGKGHRFKLANRVRRWNSPSIEVIKTFEDVKEGNKIYRYRDLTEEQIKFQKACHYLPLLENILKSAEHRVIYSLKTSRGYCMMAELFFEEDLYQGLIYFGIGKDGVLYHRYFEEKNFKKDTLKSFNTKKIEDELHEDEGQWEKTTLASFCLRSEGVLNLSIHEGRHEVNIFPVRRSLLDPNLL